MIVLSSNKNGM